MRIQDADQECREDAQELMNMRLEHLYADTQDLLRIGTWCKLSKDNRHTIAVTIITLNKLLEG